MNGLNSHTYGRSHERAHTYVHTHTQVIANGYYFHVGNERILAHPYSDAWSKRLPGDVQLAAR